MEVLAGMFGVFFAILLYAIGAWVLWKFYRALARIGEELGDIKELLAQRLVRHDGPMER
jgi:hypothetical protein